MIPAEDTVRRTPGLANVQISGQTVRRRLRESGLRDSFGGGSIMVWAGICHVGRTQLKIVQGTLNVVKYRDDILYPIVLPFLQQRNHIRVLP
jgi:hypothetical protein